MDAVEAAYLSASDRLRGIGVEQFRQMLESWDVHEIKVGGDVVGAVLVNGPEIHACILPQAQGRWIGRAQLRILNNVIKKHGYAKTTATTPTGREFVSRLGFHRHGEDYVKEVPYGH
jgi:GNAT superfamily N-acetyltransferase